MIIMQEQWRKDRNKDNLNNFNEDIIFLYTFVHTDVKKSAQKHTVNQLDGHST